MIPCNPIPSFNTLPAQPLANSPSSIPLAWGINPVYHSPADPKAIYFPCLTKAIRGIVPDTGLSISANTAAGAEEGREGRRDGFEGRDIGFDNQLYRWIDDTGKCVD